MTNQQQIAKDANTTRLMTVCASIAAICILFGSIIAHDAGKAITMIMEIVK